MITAAQLRAARALLGIDQRQLADLCGLSLPTIQRMEASGDVIRGNVDSLMKLIGALETSGVELIGDGAISQGGGRGVRLKASAKDAQKTPQPRPDEDSTPPGPRAA
jgi:transcriptional regulator with XRE-family HTH domain